MYVATEGNRQGSRSQQLRTKPTLACCRKALEPADCCPPTYRKSPRIRVASAAACFYRNREGRGEANSALACVYSNALVIKPMRGPRLRRSPGLQTAKNRSRDKNVQSTQNRGAEMLQKRPLSPIFPRCVYEGGEEAQKSGRVAGRVPATPTVVSGHRAILLRTALSETTHIVQDKRQNILGARSNKGGSHKGGSNKGASNKGVPNKGASNKGASNKGGGGGGCWKRRWSGPRRSQRGGEEPPRGQRGVGISGISGTSCRVAAPCIRHLGDVRVRGGASRRPAIHISACLRWRVT